MSRHPAMSVVLAGNDLAETAIVRECLRRQSVADQLELVLVLPDEVDPGPPETLWEGLWGGRIVRVAAIGSRGRANAAGVLEARAPIVVLSEDHAYPDPGWAEALLADHDGPWAAVGPRVKNANPATLVGWADFVIGYGLWFPAAAVEESDNIPGHNSSYKKEVLLAYGEELPRMLGSETVMHWDLRKKGYRLLLSQEASIRHLNFSRLDVYSRIQFLQGRLFAGTRAARWGWSRRLVYAVGSPLIPLVRAWRLRGCFGRQDPGGESRAPWRCWGALGWGLVLDGLGQMVGYLLGPGGRQAELASYEFCRTRFVVPADRKAVEATVAGG